jgi:hypothetical protein
MYEDYVSVDRSKEYTWPTIDWAKLESTASTLRDRLLLSLAICLPELGSGESLDRLPDYFGQAYSFVADACFDAALRGRRDMFMQLFPRFFDAALQASRRLRDKFATDQRRAVLALQPVADLMSISGYSFVLSELNESNITPVVETCWDTYFSSLPSGDARREVITLFCAVVALPCTLRHETCCARGGSRRVVSCCVVRAL